MTRSGLVIEAEGKVLLLLYGQICRYLPEQDLAIRATLKRVFFSHLFLGILLML